MKLSNLRSGIRGIMYVTVVASLLAGCSGSSGSAAGSGTSTSAPITGIATPSSVSVVTATGSN